MLFFIVSVYIYKPDHILYMFVPVLCNPCTDSYILTQPAFILYHQNKSPVVVHL